MNKKGFTLIELLAVITILGIILVIAVPQIAGIVKDSRLKVLKDSALLVAKNAEREYMVQKTTNKDFDPSNFSCSEVGKITIDYGSCSIAFDANGKASVTLIGMDTGKFKDMICSGTRENMNCIVNE